MASITFYNEGDLLDRLTDGVFSTDREVVFLVGAPISAAVTSGDRGVLDVEGVIGLIRQQFQTKIGTLTELNQLIAGRPAERYQQAFKFLLGKRNQDIANEIIKKAVIAANAKAPELSAKLKNLSDSDLMQLEENLIDWHLSPAIIALGEIVAGSPAVFGKRILTSNFDPLIEVSIATAGGAHMRTVLTGDGSLTVTTGTGCNVVHFHGYWYGADTLHTPLQLQQPRPKLKHSLGRLIGNATVVVVAYGGWDDVFTTTLLDVLDDYDSSPDIVWTFFEADQTKIQKRSKSILEKLRPGINRGRVTLFKGIDCNSFLPKLKDQLALRASAAIPDTSANASSSHHVSFGSTASNVPLSPDRRTASQKTAPPQLSDSPPRVDVWVGREIELETLSKTKSPVVWITGIGGQGKSALAATYVRDATRNGDVFDGWDWRDCREEGDRISTQISLIVERLSNATTKASQLEGQDIDSLTDAFFLALDQKRWVFVFDNVDHYINLESLRPIGALSVLLDKATKRQHAARFILTCRPNIFADDPNVLPVQLKDGLTDKATTRLFELRGCTVRGHESYIDDAHKLTAGHPLWLNLIAVQVAGNRTTLPQILSSIRKGQRVGATSTTDSIWSTLTANQQAILDPIWHTLHEQQHTILRTMAEMVRPETEGRIGEYLSSAMHWSQFSKRTKNLVALNLIVVKPRERDSELLDLHPLVREYIKNKYPTSEQDPFIASLLSVVERFITKFRELLHGEPSIDILEYWTQKVELSINRSDYRVAIETLHDVKEQLVGMGYPQEFIRIARRLFDAIDWETEFQGSSKADYVLERFVESLVQFGEREDAEKYLQKYQLAIPGKSAQYINLCDLRCYAFWYVKSYEEAIRWGEKGVNLRESSKLDTGFKCDHNLALARRDSGMPEVALSYFLKDSSLDAVVDPSSIDDERHPDYYGNIGRCLSMMQRTDDALSCYRKCASLLEQAAHDPTQRLNQGYIRLWIADALQAKGSIRLAAIFYRAAQEKWARYSPPRSLEAATRLNEMQKLHSTDVTFLYELDLEQLEHECKKWFS